MMDYAANYVDEQNIKLEILVPINHMRLRKEIYLPCELVRIDGRAQTKEYCDINEKSSIK